MRYACLVYVDDKEMAHLSAADGQNLDDQSLDYDARMTARGVMSLGQPLQPPATAVTIRIRNGRLSSTDGPFAETREHLAGFFLIEAPDRAAAIAIAAESPLAPLGSIEIRPLMDREHS